MRNEKTIFAETARGKWVENNFVVGETVAVPHRSNMIGRNFPTSESVNDVSK